MVPKTTIATFALLTIALAAFAAPVSAQSGIATGEAASQAALDAAGSYYVDGSEAMDKAEEAYDQAHAESQSQARNANSAYAESKDEAWNHVNDTEAPATPECECDEIISEIEQAGQASVAHSDRIEKAADLDTDLVDAGADVGAGATVKAFFQDAFNGIGDAFEKLGDVLALDLGAEDDAKAVAHEALYADDELRGELVGTLDDKQALPDVDSRVDGEFAAQHAGQASSSALAQAGSSLP